MGTMRRLTALLVASCGLLVVACGGSSGGGSSSTASTPAPSASTAAAAIVKTASKTVAGKSENDLRKFDVVHGVSQEISCCSINDIFARACLDTRDRRQSTSHGFQDGQAESVFERRRNIGVGGGIERKHIGRVRQKTHTVS